VLTKLRILLTGISRTKGRQRRQGRVGEWFFIFDLFNCKHDLNLICKIFNVTCETNVVIASFGDSRDVVITRVRTNLAINRLFTDEHFKAMLIRSDTFRVSMLNDRYPGDCVVKYLNKIIRIMLGSV